MTFVYNFQVEPATFGISISGGGVSLERSGPLTEYEGTITGAAAELLVMKNALEAMRVQLLDQL